MKWKNDFKTISLFLIFGIAIIAFLDLCNIPSLLGVPINNFNHSVIGWISSVLTAFVVFSLSYYLIEKWNLRNNENKREIALLLLQRAYKSCKSYLQILHGGTIPILVKRTDFNALYNHNSPADKYSDIPFENEEFIMTYAKEGHITSEQIETYLEIKSHFKQHVSLCVTFFDNSQLVQPTKEVLEKEIDKAISELG